MKKVVNICNSEFYKVNGEYCSLYDEDLWSDCDFLMLRGTNITWEKDVDIEIATDGFYGDEIMYKLSLLTDIHANNFGDNTDYIEQIINDFYNYENPEEHGFVLLDFHTEVPCVISDENQLTKLDNYVSGRPILCHLSDEDWCGRYWQYNK